MPKPRVPRPTRIVAGLAVPLVLALAACGSDPTPTSTPPNFATVPGGGQHYSFNGDVQLSNVPNPCTLLPRTSASTLLGVPVSPQHVLNNCVWSAAIASAPTLTITIQQIGSGVRLAYATSRARHTHDQPVSLSGIGQGAFRYRLPDHRTTRVEVHTSQVYFLVSIRSPTNQTRNEAQDRSVVVRVARLAAKQFTG